MSRCHIIAIKPDGLAEYFADARNAREFYVHIWTWLGEEHGYCKPGANHGGRYDDPGVDKLWEDIRKLPPEDRLVLAAAFDRCWVPRARFGDLVRELRRLGAGGRGNLWEVAHHVERLAQTDAIGVGFDSSISDAWQDREQDGLRTISDKDVYCADVFFVEPVSKRNPDPPAPLVRLAAATGRALSDLMDDYGERAGHRELCMSKDAAELAAVSDVLAMYEEER